MVRIRLYILYDCKEIMQLFYDTVHVINKKDYTEAQLDAWAPPTLDQEYWENILKEHYSIVAELDNQIVGFSDMDDTGYLDHLFVHKDYQGRGIATALLNKLEAYARIIGMDYIITHVSITAKPFFLAKDFEVVKEQKVMKRGEWFTNFIMQKKIRKQ